MSTLPISVPRPVLATGEIARNSRVGEFVRRYLEGHIPHGALKTIAVETGKDLARIYREVEGESVLSIDFVLCALHHLSMEERLALLAHVANPLGLVVYGRAERLEESKS